MYEPLRGLLKIAFSNLYLIFYGMGSKDHLLTYQDYCLLPEDGKRYEIIRGDLYNAPAPSTEHQSISGIIWDKLFNYCKRKKHGVVFYSPVDVVLSDIDVVQPDIIWISNKRRSIITSRNIQGAPDLAIEVTGEYTEKKDRAIKRRLYEKFGVKEYWVAIPETKSIEVYRLRDKKLKLIKVYTKPAEFTSPLFPGLKIKLNQIFT